MSEILLQYKRPDPTTWVYLSSFLTIGLFFVFHRFWSLRNLDIALLILLAPGLLMVHEGRHRRLVELERTGHLVPAEEKPPGDASRVGSAGNDENGDGETSDPQVVPTNEEELRAGVRTELYGFVWLLSIQLLILVRLLLDSLMVRRPLLDPNLTTGGLTFLGVWLFIFMMANVLTSTPRIQIEQGPQPGPGYSLINALPALPMRQEPNLNVDSKSVTDASTGYATLAKVLAIAAQLGIVTGIFGIGARHFNNPRAGVGCAMLYMLLPYTAQTTGRIDHALPAAFLVWAILAYRRPAIAGFFIGAAAGLIYYPLFLLPLWISFYWQRGAGRFAAGTVVALLIMTGLLALDSSKPLADHLMMMYGLMWPKMTELRGVWGAGWEPIYRLPILVAFMIVTALLTIWPAQKNLGTLIGCSAAVMVGAQFWHASGGGLYMAWFLPLLLLTIFRPNLEDRVALKVVDGGRASTLPRPRLAVEAA